MNTGLLIVIIVVVVIIALLAVVVAFDAVGTLADHDAWPVRCHAAAARQFGKRHDGRHLI